jgi:hypothetical protein
MHVGAGSPAKEKGTMGSGQVSTQASIDGILLYPAAHATQIVVLDSNPVPPLQVATHLPLKLS